MLYGTGGDLEDAVGSAGGRLHRGQPRRRAGGTESADLLRPTGPSGGWSRSSRPAATHRRSSAAWNDTLRPGRACDQTIRWRWRCSWVNRRHRRYPGRTVGAGVRAHRVRRQPDGHVLASRDLYPGGSRQRLAAMRPPCSRCPAGSRTCFVTRRRPHPAAGGHQRIALALETRPLGPARRPPLLQAARLVNTLEITGAAGRPGTARQGVGARSCRRHLPRASVRQNPRRD